MPWERRVRKFTHRNAVSQARVPPFLWNETEVWDLSPAQHGKPDEHPPPTPQPQELQSLLMIQTEGRRLNTELRPAVPFQSGQAQCRLVLVSPEVSFFPSYFFEPDKEAGGHSGGRSFPGALAPEPETTGEPSSLHLMTTFRGEHRGVPIPEMGPIEAGRGQPWSPQILEFHTSKALSLSLSKIQQHSKKCMEKQN